MSDDGLTWRFRIRAGALFHSGRPCDADAVTAEIEAKQALIRTGVSRIIASSNASPMRSSTAWPSGSSSRPSEERRSAVSPPAMRPTTSPGSVWKVGGHSAASRTPASPWKR